MSRYFIFPFLLKRLCSFVKDESGATVPLLAIALLALCGFAGVAVDLSRMQLVQARLTSSLEAAGLAAGATMNTANYQAEVTKYLQVNFPAGYMGASVPDATVTLSNNNMVLDLTATTTIPTTFMSLFGFSTMTVNAAAQITRTASGLEVVLVLDNTKSMDQLSKMTKLKTAATTLVDILTGGRESARNLWMGVVPFSHLVNIGPEHNSWTVQSSNPPFFTTSPDDSRDGQFDGVWGGCVTARQANGRDITDDPPSVELFPKFYFPAPHVSSCSSSGYNKWVKTWSGDTPTSYCSGIGTSVYDSGLYMVLGPNSGCLQKVTPLTASATTIKNAINSMYTTGYTHIAIGLVWGWRMISPRWRGFWGGEMDANGLPLDYGTPHMNKAIILLTDGENTVPSNIYTAYGLQGITVAQLDEKLTSVCNAIKNQGIFLYTIALGNPGTNIQNLLRNCATAENYYFNSPSASQLDEVFSAIGDSLSNLRVSR